MTQPREIGILKHWSTIAWVAAILFGAGFFYGDMKTLKRDMTDLSDKYGRMWQIISEQNKTILELQLWKSYHQGYEEARKDYYIKP